MKATVIVVPARAESLQSWAKCRAAMARYGIKCHGLRVLDGDMWRFFVWSDAPIWTYLDKYMSKEMPPVSVWSDLGSNAGQALIGTEADELILAELTNTNGAHVVNAVRGFKDDQKAAVSGRKFVILGQVEHFAGNVDRAVSAAPSVAGLGDVHGGAPVESASVGASS